MKPVPVADSNGAETRGGLRILLISNFYPPHVKGGAEMACAQLARWLAANGHTVAVLTLAPPGEGDSKEPDASGVTVFRKHIPNVYHALTHVEASRWKKPAWHLIDHWNPVAAARLQEVLADFQPEVVNTHNMQGMGYNLWNVLGRENLPVLVTLHDLTLLCLRQSMFKNGAVCPDQCGVCKVSGFIRRGYLSSTRRLAFVSPSRALLRAVQNALPQYADRGSYLPNPLAFSTREDFRPTSSVVHLLYTGQVEPHKGVPFLLEVLAALPAKNRFRLTVVGKGGALNTLKEKYADEKWVQFLGFVPPEQVGAHMSAADVLLLPSLWLENQPLVALQARALGLPLMVSDMGGLPELVEDRAFGRIIEAGSHGAWSAALEEIISEPAIIDQWKTEAIARRGEFDVDALGEKYVGIVRGLICAS